MDKTEIKAAVEALSPEAVVAAGAIACREILSGVAGISKSDVARLIPQIASTMDMARSNGDAITTMIAPDVARSALVAMAESESLRPTVQFSLLAVADEPVVPLGWGDEVRKVLLAASLALTLPFVVAKTGIDIELPSVQIKVAEGVPQGLGEILDKLKAIIDTAIPSAPPPDTAPAEQRAHRLSVFGAAPALGQRRALLSRSEALCARDELWRIVNSRKDLPYIDDAEQCLKAAGRAPSKRVGIEGAYRVDVGLYRQFIPDSPAGSEPRFRLAVRLQGQRGFKKKALDEIEAYLKERTGGLSSVRAIGEVRFLNAPRGNRWCGPTVLSVGAQISTAGGTHGSVTAFVRKPVREDRIVYALSAGHVLSDFGRMPLNTIVYHPAQTDTPDPRHALGKLFDVRILERSAMALFLGTDPMPAGVDLDCGLVALSPDRVPPTTDIRQVPELGSLAGIRPAPKLDPNSGNHPPLWKAPGATGRREGWVTAEDVIVQVTMPDFSVVAGVGLTEVVGSGGPFAGAGDSGSICVDADRFGCGMVVAGTRFGGIVDRSRGVSYILDLEAVFDGLTIELA